MDRAGRHGRIDVNDDEFRINTRCAKGGFGGVEKLLVVQYHLGVVYKGLPDRGPVSPEPRKKRPFCLWMLCFLPSRVQSVGCDGTIGGMSLKHVADLFGFVECRLDANGVYK